MFLGCCGPPRPPPGPGWLRACGGGPCGGCWALTPVRAAAMRSRAAVMAAIETRPRFRAITLMSSWN